MRVISQASSAQNLSLVPTSHRIKAKVTAKAHIAVHNLTPVISPFTRHYDPTSAWTSCCSSNMGGRFSL